MSRGFDFDSFEMDDFRESDSYDRGREASAGKGSGSLFGASVRLQLQKLREKETISEPRARELVCNESIGIPSVTRTAHCCIRKEHL
jgi:hypothetical protein